MSNGKKLLAQSVGGTAQVRFSTSKGTRVVDQFSEGVTHESKTGYQYLNNATRNQIIKDPELKASGDVKDVVWHFYRSPVTGQQGYSEPLGLQLLESGITIINH